MTEPKNAASLNDPEVLDILNDLERLQGLKGKEWSVAQARKLGLSDADIEKYFGAK